MELEQTVSIACYDHKEIPSCTLIILSNVVWHSPYNLPSVFFMHISCKFRTGYDDPFPSKYDIDFLGLSAPVEG